MFQFGGRKEFAVAINTSHRGTPNIDFCCCDLLFTSRDTKQYFFAFAIHVLLRGAKIPFCCYDSFFTSGDTKNSFCCCDSFFTSEDATKYFLLLQSMFHFGKRKNLFCCWNSCFTSRGTELIFGCCDPCWALGNAKIIFCSWDPYFTSRNAKKFRFAYILSFRGRKNVFFLFRSMLYSGVRQELVLLLQYILHFGEHKKYFGVAILVPLRRTPE